MTGIRPPRLVLGLWVLAAMESAAGAECGDLAAWVASATAARAMRELRADLVESVSSGVSVRPSRAITWPGEPRGIFVSLLEGGRVVGCMGSFAAPRKNLYAASLETALRATREDVRHRPLDAEDVARARIVVTFVGAPEPIEDPAGLRPWREGLLAVQGDSSAVVVPGEAKTTRYALELTLRGSGIDPRLPIEYHRFDAITWREDPPQGP